MTFSQYAGIAIVPTLSRLVLATAFITSGYQKVFTKPDFTYDKAQRLHELGVSLDRVSPLNEPAPGDGGRDRNADGAADASDGGDARNGDSGEPRASANQARIVPATWRTMLQDPSEPQPAAPTRGGTGSLRQPPGQSPPRTADPDPAVTPPPPDAADQNDSDEAADPDPIDVAPIDADAAPPSTSRSAPAIVLPLEPGTYRAQGLHNITLMLDSKGWGYPIGPVWMAYLAAFTELVGGALLLVGLFSRVWGLGLSIVMIVAFYMTTWGVLAGGTSPIEMTIPQLNTMYGQLGLFVLAFGILLTGPGPLSLDRFLFGRSRDEIIVEEVRAR